MIVSEESLARDISLSMEDTVNALHSVFHYAVEGV